jgi:hypothetical protein
MMGRSVMLSEDLSFKFSKLEEVLSRALRSLVNIEKFVEVDFRLLLIQKEQKQWVPEPKKRRNIKRASGISGSSAAQYDLS